MLRLSCTLRFVRRALWVAVPRLALRAWARPALLGIASPLNGERGKLGRPLALQAAASQSSLVVESPPRRVGTPTRVGAAPARSTGGRRLRVYYDDSGDAQNSPGVAPPTLSDPPPPVQQGNIALSTLAVAAPPATPATAELVVPAPTEAAGLADVVLFDEHGFLRDETLDVDDDGVRAAMWADATAWCAWWDAQQASDDSRRQRERWFDALRVVEVKAELQASHKFSVRRAAWQRGRGAGAAGVPNKSALVDHSVLVGVRVASPERMKPMTVC